MCCYYVLIQLISICVHQFNLQNPVIITSNCHILHNTIIIRLNPPKITTKGPYLWRMVQVLTFKYKCLARESQYSEMQILNKRDATCSEYCTVFLFPDPILAHNMNQTWMETMVISNANGFQNILKSKLRFEPIQYYWIRHSSTLQYLFRLEVFFWVALESYHTAKAIETVATILISQKNAILHTNVASH